MKSNEPQKILRDIYNNNGSSILDEPQRIKGFLLDFCPSYKREINLLLAALSERVPQILLSTSTIPREILVGQLTKKLHDHHGITDDYGRWAIEVWRGVVCSDCVNNGPIENDDYDDECDDQDYEDLVESQIYFTKRTLKNCYALHMGKIFTLIGDRKATHLHYCCADADGNGHKLGGEHFYWYKKDVEIVPILHSERYCRSCCKITKTESYKISDYMRSQAVREIEKTKKYISEKGWGIDLQILRELKMKACIDEYAIYVFDSYKKSLNFNRSERCLECGGTSLGKFSMNYDGNLPTKYSFIDNGTAENILFYNCEGILLLSPNGPTPTLKIMAEEEVASC